MNINALEARLLALEKKADEVEELKSKVKSLEKEVTTLRDIEEIKRLQKAYGYYVEHMMYQEIVDCFADHQDVRLNWLEGQWLGKEGVKKYFRFMKSAPPEFQHQVMQLAGIVNVHENGMRANGRWYAFGGIFIPMEEMIRRSFVSGIYEMGYIKEGGLWKILSIKWVIPYAVRIPEGWAMPEDINKPYIEGNFRGPAPDLAINKNDLRYVTGYIFPFHYKHPVTGKETSEAEKNAQLRKILAKRDSEG